MRSHFASIAKRALALCLIVSCSPKQTSGVRNSESSGTAAVESKTSYDKYMREGLRIAKPLNREESWRVLDLESAPSSTDETMFAKDTGQQRQAKRKESMENLASLAGLAKNGALLAAGGGLKAFLGLNKTFMGHRFMKVSAARFLRDPVGAIQFLDMKGMVPKNSPDGSTHFRVEIPFELYEPETNLKKFTLGRGYFNFMNSNGFSIADEKTDLPLNEWDPVQYMFARHGQTHDLWHVALGLNPSEVEEVAFHSFVLAQDPVPHSAMLTYGLMIKKFLAGDPYEFCMAQRITDFYYVAGLESRKNHSRRLAAFHNTHPGLAKLLSELSNLAMMEDKERASFLSQFKIANASEIETLRKAVAESFVDPTKRRELPLRFSTYDWEEALAKKRAISDVRADLGLSELDDFHYAPSQGCSDLRG